MPPKKLSKRQREALDPSRLEENIPTFTEGVKNLMSNLLPQAGSSSESALPQGNKSKNGRQSEFGRYNQPMLGEINTQGLTDEEVRQAQAQEKMKADTQAKQQALQTYLDEQKKSQEAKAVQEDLSLTDRLMGREPELSPADINEQIALDRALKTNPELAQPQNQTRFLKAIREKMRQRK